MASVSRTATLQEWADFVDVVYSVPNDRHYTLWDMLTNIQRFSARCIKGIRKNDTGKTDANLLIALSWFTSLMNRLHISLDDIVWSRFPYLCSYCGERPCVCKAEKVKSRRKVAANGAMRPRTVQEYQEMFDKIYPPERRTPQDAAIHLAEEMGELTEAFHLFMSDRSDAHFREICIESADYFSCLMGVLNSVRINCADELAKTYSDNCPVCHAAPCSCSFKSVSEFKS